MELKVQEIKSLMLKKVAMSLKLKAQGIKC